MRSIFARPLLATTVLLLSAVRFCGSAGPDKSQKSGASQGNRGFGGHSSNAERGGFTEGQSGQAMDPDRKHFGLRFAAAGVARLRGVGIGAAHVVGDE